jgi:protein-S-isoprenylcysteine O-methyltransferase Ste14
MILPAPMIFRGSPTRLLRNLANFGFGYKYRPMTSLDRKASTGLAILVAVTASLLFGAAGTFHYWQAWLFLVAYFAPSLAITLYLIKEDPALLARRMSGGPFAEKEPVQKIIMSIVSLGFVGLIVLPALDHRVGWSPLSPTMVLIGDLLVLTGWLGVFLVFRENSFGAATIELSEDQRVISTGPYAWVRHPMYAAGLLMLSGIPLALGSGWSVLLVLALLPALVWRLKDEEEFLARNLPGYREYQHSVHYRLLPSIW